jgi:hypothetical protein
VNSFNFIWLVGPRFTFQSLREGWGSELEDVQSCSSRKMVVVLCA